MVHFLVLAAPPGAPPCPGGTVRVLALAVYCLECLDPVFFLRKLGAGMSSKQAKTSQIWEG